MTSIKRLAALLTVAGLLDLAGGTPAFAGIDMRPRAETNCLRSRVVLRPEFGSSLNNMLPGERVPLVQVRICSFALRTCMTNGEQVPFSQCAAKNEPELSETLTTE